ncbi:MAG TPA: hypothetical protein VGQ91_02165, partial [Ideonella sp.]|nr:hypothetical protein [Ideonella sp.]
MSGEPGSASPRHAVDRVEFLAVEGWALRADGSPAQPSLWHAGVPLPATLERLARPDVQAHWGGGVALDCGFVLRPDARAWRPPLGPGAQPCELRFDGVPGATVDLSLDGPHLLGWINAVADAPASDWREAERERLRALLSSSEIEGGAPLLAWAEQRWLQPGAPTTASLRFAVEHIDGLRVIGWVNDTNADTEAFSVHCGQASWAVVARRVARADVLQALGDARLNCGFELDLPSDIWAATGSSGDAWVQLQANGHGLWPRPHRLARASLAPALQAALAVPDPAVWPPPGSADFAPLAEQRWRLGQLIEHAAAAGVLAEAPAALRAALRRRLADADWARLRVALDVSRAARDPATEAEPDAEACAVWRLQQAFNQALDAALRAGMDQAAALAQALNALLAGRRPTESTAPVQTCLASLVPSFCAAGAVDRLRPHLARDHLVALEQHQGRWELSLLLPLALRDELPDGRLTHALALAERLARPEAAGWLNTEALLDTLQALHATLQAGAVVDDEELHRFVEAMLALWERLAADGWWSRLYDEGLLRSQCILLCCMDWLDEAQGLRVVQAALRHYALVPAFWRACEAVWPARQDWPAALAEASAGAQPLLAAMQSGEAGAARGLGPDTWAWLRDQSGADAQALRRHALVALRGDRAQVARALAGLQPEEALRADPAALGDAGVARAISPVPWPEQSAQRARAWQATRRLIEMPAMQGIAQQQDLAALLATTGEQAGGLGLLLLLSVARRAPAGSPLADDAAAALGASLVRAFEASARRPAASGRPPAALCAVGAGLGRWSTEADAPAFAKDLSASWQDRALKLWGRAGAAAADTPPDPELRSSLPGAGALLIWRARPEMPAEELDRLADQWSAALKCSAAPWLDLCVWQPPADPAQGPGPTFDLGGPWPRLRHAGLFDLLGWLLAHSDHGHFMLLPDDAELAIDTWLARTDMLCAHHHGVADRTLPTARVRLDAGRLRFDASPQGTAVGSVASGLGVSRQAVAWTLGQLADPTLPRWAAAAFDEEKRLADLLATLGLPLDERGYWVCHARAPVTSDPAAFVDLPLPRTGSPTVLRLGDSVAALAAAGAEPRRIWPTDRPPRLIGAAGSQQLVCLHDPFGAAPLGPDEVGVFAVARNERVLMPHFLAHYRG